MSRRQLLEQLAEQLAQEHGLLRQLFDQLEQEHQSLKDKDVDALTAAVEAKSATLEQFDQAMRTRMETLVELGLEESSEGEPQRISSLIEACGKELPEILENWKELEALLLKCKEQNTINGAIIEVSSQVVQTAYSLLTAKPVTEPELYNAKGRSNKKGGPGGNSLAKA